MERVQHGYLVVGRPAHLSQVDELFLMLVRLQLNLKEQDLAYQFDISVSSICPESSQPFVTLV